MTNHTSPWMNEELEMLQDAVARFYEKEMVPLEEKWADQGYVDREFWLKAGEAGILCANVPEEYGGPGGSIFHEAVIMSEQFRARGYSGFTNVVHSLVCSEYLLNYATEEQKHRWLPKMVSGEMICGVAMTEPSGGTDLQAVKTTARLDGDHYVINGSKTFITLGMIADLLILVVKTDPKQTGRGISLIMVETENLEGFRRGRNLKKLGMSGSDTAELFFDDVRVPRENLLGGNEGRGFGQLMDALAKERLSLGITGVAVMEKALSDTIAYTAERNIFGKSMQEMQNTRFKLAEIKTTVHVARIFVDDCIQRFADGTLDSATASMVKLWVSEKQNDIVDECLQLHGGYGYMMEYPISHMYADARIQRIYGGANEIMKELIARSITA